MIYLLLLQKLFKLLGCIMHGLCNSCQEGLHIFCKRFILVGHEVLSESSRTGYRRLGKQPENVGEALWHPRPGRSSTGRRQYDESDLTVIRRMAALVAVGVPASEAAEVARVEGGAPDNVAAPERAEDRWLGA